jgi:uncharacterized protein YbjQ (UPF0145 family)/RimJ/RimL family protein N-acetyltransferase
MDEIRADGVHLRLWADGDQETIADIVNTSRAEFTDWLPGVMSDLADLDAFVERVAASAAEGTGWYYAIEAGDGIVGQCSLTRREPGVGEIGYWIRSDRTNRGTATLAVRAVSVAAFDRGFTKLIIHCDEGNGRSASVARKAGFDYVGTAPVQSRFPPSPVQTGREMTWVRHATTTYDSARPAPPTTPLESEMSDTSAADERLPIPCSTTFDFPGMQVERHVGLCWGLIVRSIGFAKGFSGSIRALKSGEVTQYTAVLEEARRHALDRLIEHARAMGANGIAGVRFDSSEIGNNMSEILAYGTGVLLAPAN